MLPKGLAFVVEGLGCANGCKLDCAVPFAPNGFEGLIWLENGLEAAGPGIVDCFVCVNGFEDKLLVVALANGFVAGVWAGCSWPNAIFND